MTSPVEQPDERHKLCVEIFEKTGYKVDVEDPIIAVAMFHSKILREAADYNTQVSARAAAALEEKFSKIAQSTIEKLISSQRRASIELMNEFRDRVFQLPKQAQIPDTKVERPSPSQSKWTVWSRGKAVAGCLLLIATSFATGVLWAHPNLNNAELKIMGWGRAAIAVFPLLDETSKKKLSDQLKKDDKTPR